jgi:hypothetical protein
VIQLCAVLVCDECGPAAVMAERLLLSGYHVDVAGNLEIALGFLRDRPHQLLVAGPLHQVPELQRVIKKAHRLGVETIVVSDNPHGRRLALRLAMAVVEPSTLGEPSSGRLSMELVSARAAS